MSAPTELRSATSKKRDEFEIVLKIIDRGARVEILRETESGWITVYNSGRVAVLEALVADVEYAQIEEARARQSASVLDWAARYIRELELVGEHVIDVKMRRCRVCGASLRRAEADSRK